MRSSEQAQRSKEVKFALRAGEILSLSEPGEFERLFGEPHGRDTPRRPARDFTLRASRRYRSSRARSATAFEQEAESVSVRFAMVIPTALNLVVGADGISLSHPRQLFPEVRLRYSGYTAWRGRRYYRDEVALGVTRRVGDVALASDR
jgi:hypothetical protein